MTGLSISSGDVLQYASQVKSLENNISTVFQEVRSKMNQVNEVWNSPASQSLIQQFQTLIPVFDNYVQAIDQYAIFLNQTAEAYQENEQSLQQAFQ